MFKRKTPRSNLFGSKTIIFKKHTNKPKYKKNCNNVDIFNRSVLSDTTKHNERQLVKNSQI